MPEGVAAARPGACGHGKCPGFLDDAAGVKSGPGKREARSRGAPSADGRLRCLSIVSGADFALALCMWSGTAGAQSLESLIDRIDMPERENRELRRETDAVNAGWRSGEGMEERPGGTAFEGGPAGYVRMDPGSGCAIRDPTDSTASSA